MIWYRVDVVTAPEWYRKNEVAAPEPIMGGSSSLGRLPPSCNVPQILHRKPPKKKKKGKS